MYNVIDHQQKKRNKGGCPFIEFSGARLYHHYGEFVKGIVDEVTDIGKGNLVIFPSRQCLQRCLLEFVIEI